MNEDSLSDTCVVFASLVLSNMASHKIAKVAGAQPTTEFELTVAQALVDLENNVPELKKDLRPLQITAAKEVRRWIERDQRI